MDAYMRMRISIQVRRMTAQTRWNLSVSRDTDISLRTFLASRGGRKGDLSRFVEDAVNRAVLSQTLQEIWDRNRDLDPEQVQQLVDREMAAMRAERPRQTAE